MRWPEVLLEPGAYPHAPETVEVRETHASWIALAGAFAYKVKRPVTFRFLDYSTLERRREACAVELALNARWAPALYLDLQAAVAAGDGIRFVPAAASEPEAILEYAVRMRRFPAGAELDALLVRGAVAAPELAAFGRSVAGWQATARRVAADAPYGRPADLLQAALDNFSAPLPAGAACLGALGEWLRARHAVLEPLLAQRRAAGYVRECHGDLHARNVVRIDGALLPFDGIDFAAELRCIDVAADVAFLAMDLERFGRTDLAHAFLDAWLEASGDHDAPIPLRWLIAYRALVRAKVDALRASELRGGAAATVRDEILAYVRVAEAQASAGPGTLYATTGPSGSGKSHVAAALALELPALRLRSDVERKRLAGLPALARSGAGVDAGLYAPEHGARTYARLADTATRWLGAGWNVIVDSAALLPEQREMLRDAARRAGASQAWLECTAPPAVLRERVASRRGDPSEATLEVLERQLARPQPPNAGDRARTVSVDTSRRVDVLAVAAALRSAAAPPVACSPSSAPES